MVGAFLLMPMPRLNVALDVTLAGMRPHLDPEVYAFAAVGVLPPRLDSCFAIIREPTSITLVLTEAEAQRLRLDVSFRCRRIDPGMDTSLDALGVIAAISTALAVAGIALNPIAAVARDHLFVPADRADDALEVLHEVVRAAQLRRSSTDAGLQAFASDLWIAEGPPVKFYTMSYPTRMTVIRLNDGRLWLHSPIRYSAVLGARLDALGEIAYLVAPNPLHHLFIEGWAAAYPGATCLAAPGVAPKLPRLALKALSEPDPGWQCEIDHLVFEGSPLMKEAVFHHRASRTLIVTDLIERFDPRSLSAKDRLLARLAGVTLPHGGMPLDWRLSFFGQGRRRARACFARMQAWAPERLVMAHGEPIDADATACLHRALPGFATASA